MELGRLRESVALKAVSQCAGDLKRDLGERVPDLIMLFMSSHHAAEEEYTRIPELVRRHFGESLLLDCSVRGVIQGCNRGRPRG